MNRIRQIAEQGQSVWYDFIRRGMIWSGALHRLVEEDGLAGVTSNPAIFEKAITGSTDYAAALEASIRSGASASEALDFLVVEDIQWAADVLRPVWERTRGLDGFVSIEVSPHLAYDTTETIEEGLRLFEAVGRDNLMVKVPATPQGVPAIERLIASGVNVNVTLLFAIETYEEVADAYMSGLERLVASGKNPASVASVASFFVSRIDTAIDKMLDERLLASPSAEVRGKIDATRGEVAIANAKLAYRAFTDLMRSPRWKRLEERGARPQRLLWASTSAKNPKIRDVRYVEDLIGPQTVNTIPEDTYRAFLDHGVAEPRLARDLDAAERTLDTLRQLDISLSSVTERLLRDGVAMFVDAFDRLISTLEHRRRAILGSRTPTMHLSIGEREKPLESSLEELRTSGFVRRMWHHDGSLWSKDTKDLERIEGCMGWLEVVDEMLDHPEHLMEIAEDIEAEGIEDVVILGMGGSSLAAEVFARTLGSAEGAARVHVLDSTVPAQIRAIEATLDMDRTLFVVASKSGTTIEPYALERYFFDKVRRGERFVAITDPESELETSALERDYKTIFNGIPEIGGRYSALSPFGLVPAAALGLDIVDLLERARRMVGSCESVVPASANVGVRLGVAIGKLALEGRDKLTIVASPGLVHLGGWLEQLVAESTGKNGKGVVPIDRERLGAPAVYGDDRVFVRFALRGDIDPRASKVEEELAALERAGHPVFRFELDDARDVVQEMFRWEVATAACAHVLGVNPFDQPNVQESKDFTKSLLDVHARTGELPRLPGETLLVEEDDVRVYTDAAGGAHLSGEKSLRGVLAAHLSRVRPRDYVAFNAFIEMSEANSAALDGLRHRVRDRTRAATTVGFGPRFLHSTGQLHKGGPDTGLFIQITCEDSEDLRVPGERYTFGALKGAQQRGDFQALSQRGRRLIRIHVSSRVDAALRRIESALS